MKLNFHHIFMGLVILLASALSLHGVSYAQDSTETLPLRPTDAPDACVPDSQQIRVQILGSYKKGIIKAEVYRSEDGFLQKKGRLRIARVAAEDGPVMMCFNVDAPGRYAVSAYHDINANRKLDKAWNYKPEEPFALSNNPSIKTLRMPKFDECAFDVGPNGADINIDMVDASKE